MSADHMRFIHAADLRLEEPLRGLNSVPSHLRSHLIEAPFVAAEKVFSAAIEHRVDFVLLAGDVMDFSCGDPRSVAFLQTQFERLDKQGIGVYWVGGRIDPPSHHPATLKWADNVTYFKEPTIHHVTHSQRGVDVAEIIAVPPGKRRQLNAADLACSSEDVACLVLSSGTIEEAVMDEVDVDYWAFGGSHEFKKLRDDETTAVIAGSPQGRTPRDTDSHGCVLVTYQGPGHISCRRLATAAVRWRTEQIRLAQGTTRAEIESELGERLLNVATEESKTPTLLTIRLSGGATRFSSQLGDELANWARNEFGQSNPPIWTLDVDVAPPKRFPERWYAEESILGDFLREAEQRTESDDLGVDSFVDWIPESLHESLGTLLEFSSEKEKATAFARAAKQGVDLLRGDDAA